MATLHPVLLDQLNRAVRTTERAKMYTARDIRLPDIPGKVHAVIGMRRAGKTTFLRQLQAERRQALPPERAIYLTFDDDRLAGIDAEQLSLLLEEYYRRYPALRNEETVHWYLDEIQLVDGWERFIRRAGDTESIEFVVSGSSARLLSKEVHTSLRGRSIATVVRPFSFREFLRHRGEEPQEEPELWTPSVRSMIENRFDQYLRGGGFPEAQGVEARARVTLLQGYVDSVLFRDIVERYQVRQVAALRWLVRFLLRNPAGKVNTRRLYDDLRSQGLAVGRDTVSDLLEHVSDAFLIDLVSLATDSERKRNTNPRVAYPVDTGLIQAFDASGRLRIGRALETAVEGELARRQLDVTYYRSPEGYEVDFLVRDYEGNDDLVQVCADVSSEETLARELRALEAAAEEYPHARRTLLVLTRDDAMSVDAAGVNVQPAYEWLLKGMS